MRCEQPVQLASPNMVVQQVVMLEQQKACSWGRIVNPRTRTMPLQLALMETICRGEVTEQRRKGGRRCPTQQVPLKLNILCGLT